MITKKLRSKEYGPACLLSPEFKYVPAAATDIRATFERVRREVEEQAQKENITQLRRKK